MSNNIKKEIFELCAWFKKDNYDFNRIQMDKDNPLDVRGYPTYPKVVSSKLGSSYTYQISKDLFFKRRLQDGEQASPQDYALGWVSLHHTSLADNELKGTFDDLGEVLSYHISKRIIDPKTGEPIIRVPEYRLACYDNERNEIFRGCTSRNVCENSNQKLVSMADVMSFVKFPDGKSIDHYMAALEKYVAMKGIDCDMSEIRRRMVVDSGYNWETANSDNHKNNVVLIEEKVPNGKTKMFSKWIIDNGSCYELSSRYMNQDGKLRFAALYEDDITSRVDENGNRVLDFAHYPYMHAAFQLESDKLLIPDTTIGGISYSYEYSLASEMLEDAEIYRQMYEIDRQLDIDAAIADIDSIYGAGKKGEEEINWPPHLKEFMHATDDLKSKVLSYVVSDYFLKVAFNEMIGRFDSKKFADLFESFKNDMMQVPLLESKEEYEKVFVAIAQKHGIEIDINKLKTIKFKDEDEPANAKQPNE